MTKDLHIDHEAMARVVRTMDQLIAELASKGSSGSYASMQGAARVAQAVKSVAEREMGVFLTQYNAGFGAAARDYQTLANTIVAVRNKVAATANLHAANDHGQARSFAPLAVSA